jgi:hypothetical protein
MGSESMEIIDRIGIDIGMIGVGKGSHPPRLSATA